MGKKTKPYVLNGLEAIAMRLKEMMQVPELRVNLRGLEKSIKNLPKVHRERLEKFFGLTGGPTFSEKIGNYVRKDVAIINMYGYMYNAALESISELIKHEYMILFDEEYIKAVKCIVKKVDKKGISISDYDIVSYMAAFFTFIVNGPKMSFESNPLFISGEEMQELIFDKYAMIKELSRGLEKLNDNSVNLKLLMDLFEIIDYKDRLIIQKSMGIQILDEPDLEDIPNLKKLKDIRAFKEKMFPYGAWHVTIALILGNYAGKIELKEFMIELEKICRDWSKISEFKIGKAGLQVLRKLRTLDVYDIGGLEFTDPYEVTFLYLERNIIWD